MSQQKRVIHSLTLSPCCNASQQLVRSRDGNFVTQDCIACGKKARTLALAEIPSIRCPVCPTMLTIGFVDKNYGTRCAECGSVFELGTLLPHWQDEGFQYCGVATPNEYS
jgi:hypothetical protein